MKAKLIEYRWTEDVSMDPYNRSGDGNKRRGGILISGDNSPSVLVLMHNGTPVFHEMTAEDSGEDLWSEFGIACYEWECHEIGEVELTDDLIQNARVMAGHKKLADKTTYAFHEIFKKLDDEDED